MSFTGTGSIAFGGNGARTLTLTGSNTGNNTFAPILGNGTGGATALTKSGTGTWVLSPSSANTFTGATMINTNGGTLNAAANGALGSTSSITINSGGTLMLSNSAATDRIGNTVGISLAGGTILRSGSGVSEGTGAHTTNGGVTHTGTSAAGMGALTLTTNSTLDFGTSGVGTLVFSSFIPNAHVLNIIDYTNTHASYPLVSGTDGTDDRLIFNSDQATNLADFSFGGTSALEIALGGGFFEIVPVPEPSTWFAAALAVGGLALMQRKRIKALCSRA